MQATEILMEEHRVIEKVLDSLETASNRLAAGQTIPADFLFKAVDFIRNFADGCHHQKEEGILFLAMEANGMPQNIEPVSVFLEEHKEGRRLTRAMLEGAERIKIGDAAFVKQVVQNARDYVSLLREHIQREDLILFPLADQVIPASHHHQLMEDFNRIEDRDEIQEKYLRISNELAEDATANTL